MNSRMRLLAVVLVLSSRALADGAVVDKIYHPYVLPIEREIESRTVAQETDKGNRLLQKLALGYSLSETVAAEAYVIGQRDENNEFDLYAYELEARWMLTEQGRYWADWGTLFELEKSPRDDNWEATTGLLMEKEIGRTSLTLNALATYEWGRTIREELDMQFRAQYRYRWKPQFQPAVELYTGEDFTGVGPAVLGMQRFDKQKLLKWEAGYITEVVHSGRNNTFRLALEYEY